MMIHTCDSMWARVHAYKKSNCEIDFPFHFCSIQLRLDKILRIGGPFVETLIELFHFFLYLMRLVISGLDDIHYIYIHVLRKLLSSAYALSFHSCTTKWT